MNNASSSVQDMFRTVITSHATLGIVWGLVFLIFCLFSVILHYHWHSYGSNTVIKRAMIIYYIGSGLILLTSGILLFFV